MQVRIEHAPTREAVDRVASLVAAAGGRALLVGGCVRDAAFERPALDVDVEVYGLAPDRLRSALAREFELDLVGKAFGILRLRGVPVDVALPRTESKVAPGHRGFEVHSDPDLDFEQAAERRDFTLNSMGWDPVTGELLDPYGGMADLEARVLRHTSAKFAEDPLRVLRGMQFAARYELRVAPETVALCRTIDTEGLAPERIWEEWKKLLTLGTRPSLGLGFLRDCAWLRHYPELEALVGCEQDPEWHPEGDVWVHTLHCLDHFAGERTGDPWEDLVVGLGVLCHDLGKPPTTRFEEGRWRSRGHDVAGLEPTERFLRRLTPQRDVVEQVLPLVQHHLRPFDLHRDGAGDAAVRRLARKVGRIDRLVRVARADQAGRPPMAFDTFPAGEWLLERARALSVEDRAPDPLVMGRHLIEMGLQPGPAFRTILDACYEAQLDGQVTTLEEGLALAAATARESAAAARPGDGSGEEAPAAGAPAAVPPTETGAP